MALLTILPCSIRLNKYVTGIGLQVVRGAQYLAMCLWRSVSGSLVGLVHRLFSGSLTSNGFRHAVVCLVQTLPVLFPPSGRMLSRLVDLYIQGNSLCWRYMTFV